MKRILAASLALLAATAQAQPYQEEWAPNRYAVVCRPGDQCPLNDEEKRRVVNALTMAVDDYRKGPFPAPKTWGDRKRAANNQHYIEIYQNNTTLALAGLNYDTGRSNMVVGPMMRKHATEDYLLYYFTAHEVFHLIGYSSNIVNHYRQTMPPGWIYESTATAVGHHMMRQRYPGVAPSTRSDREARSFSGLRSYAEPLPRRAISGLDGKEMTSGDRPQYYTSSFWRHLAEAHYGGRYSFLRRYNQRSNRDPDNWIPWFRNNIEQDLGVNLGMVFSGFLADYAGWGDRGMPGTYFGRKTWLQNAFEGCEEVYLDRNDPVGEVDVNLLPMTGKCIEVRIGALGESGVNPDDLFAVQVASVILDGTADYQGLHLGRAAWQDKENFHCARGIKRDPRAGVGRCIFYPDDGQLRLYGQSMEARVWNVHAQDPTKSPVISDEGGDGGERNQSADPDRGEVVNLYTVAYTPESFTEADTREGGRNPISARLFFVLDVARLDIAGKKKKTVGSFSTTSQADPLTSVPKVTPGGVPTNSYSLPEALQGRQAASMGAPPAVPNKLTSFQVAPRSDGGSPSAATGIFLIPARLDEQGKLQPYPLSVGETGPFELGVTGALDGDLLMPLAPGSLIVEEFTDLTFRARFEVTLCRIKDWDEKADRCAEPLPSSGNVVKAFAGSRLPGQAMVVTDTPGTRMYREAITSRRGMMLTLDPDDPGPGAPGDDAPAGAGSSAGGQTSACACTCEERDAMIEQGMAFKTAHESGEAVDAGSVMGLMRCQEACQSEYMACALEDNEEEPEETESETVADCNCACPENERRQARMMELAQGMSPGDLSVMDEMQQLGQCMETCHDEMMACMMERR